MNYMKLLSLLAFVAFAAVSCWATAESLHLLLPSWPVVLCWIVTIGFFVIASLGSKMIVDSMNPNIYQERRGLTLMGGLFLLLVFWLVCSDSAVAQQLTAAKATKASSESSFM